MVRYKKLWEEAKRHISKLQAWTIDLRPETVKYRKENQIPIILTKKCFRIEEYDDKYHLYDV